MQFQATTQEEAIEVLQVLACPDMVDIGCATVTIGQHQEFGTVIAVIGDNGQAALLKLS